MITPEEVIRGEFKWNPDSSPDNRCLWENLIRPAMERYHELKSKAEKPTGKTLEERKAEFTERVKGFTEYSPAMLVEFIDYWTEHNENGKKMRFEKQPVFDIKRRLQTWDRNAKRFNNGNKNSYNTSRSDRALEAYAGFGSSGF